MDSGFAEFPTVLELGIMFGCQIQTNEIGGCRTHTGSMAFVHYPQCGASSVNPRHASSPLCDAQKKTVCGACGQTQSGWYDRRRRKVRDLSCGGIRIYLEVEIWRVQCRRCGVVKRERMEFLADNPLYTRRFAHYVGRRCRQATTKDMPGCSTAARPEHPPCATGWCLPRGRWPCHASAARAGRGVVRAWL